MSRKFCIDKFWNNTKFLNQKYPIFTECFQFSILIIPCIIFDTSFLIYIACKMYKSQRIMKVPFDIWHILKLGIHCLIIALLVMEILMDWQNSISNLDEIYIISYVLLCSTIVFVIIHTEIRRQTMHPVCIILFIFWFSITLAYLIKFYNNIIQSIQSKVTIYFIKSILLSGGIFLLFLISFLIECFPRFSPDWILINKKIPCPEEYASIISKLTYSWLDKYIYNWFKHEMTDQTSFDLQREDESLKSINEVEKVFLAKISKYKLTKRNVEELDILSSSANLLQDENKTMKDEIKRPGFILFCSLLKIFKYKIFISWSFKLIHDIFIYLSPFLLKILLETVKDKNSIAWISYIFAFCFLFCGLISSLSENLCFFISWRVSIRVRAALIGMLYKKTLRLSNEERNKYTSGEIVNLMSIDTERIMIWVIFSWYIFSCPFQIIVALYLLYKEIGYSIFAGVGVIIFSFLLNGCIMGFLQKYSEAELGWKDKRIKLLTEILNGIKILKMYAWERSFLMKITKLRDAEMKYIMRVTSGWAVVSCIWESLPFVIMLVSFLTFIFVDITNVLTAEKAFVCLTLFNLIKFPMVILPWGLTDTVNIFVSMKRIGEFLVGAELDNSERYHDDDTIGPKSPDDVVVKICHGSFSWKKDEKIILNNINLEINRGKLLAIVGKVGTGKSSLLSAILGEMHKITGSIKIEGKIAFVSQEAWIQNKSLKENILFTRSYDEESYNKIIEACSLISDFDQLPARDETEIGERGINLSGGQKQRVSLARSVYQNHDIYLLDDPLSAVDAHVGEHLFNNVISNKGILNGKTRIMVTHGLHWLPKVDEIIVLDSNGSVSERGTFKDLLRSDGNEFMQFIQEHIGNLKGNTDESVELNDDSEISEAVKLLKKVSESKDVEEEFLGLVLNNDIISKRKICNSKAKERTLSEESRKSTESINGLLSENFTVKRHQISPGSLEKGRIFARQMSLETNIKTDNTNLQNDLMIKPLGNLTDEEQTMTGEIKLKTYFMYVKSRGLKLFVTTILIYILYTAMQIYNNVWLKQFTEDPFIQNATSELSKNTSYSPEMSTIIREKTKFYMLVYTGIGMGMTFMLVLYWLGYTIGTVNASKRLHKILLYSILRSPMKFFDTTPSGRIINRFSKDIEIIDHTMPMNLSDMICCFFVVLGSIGIIVYVTPWFSVIIIPLIILYYLIQLFYMPSSRQARRLDSISSSPIFSNFTETIQGLAVIRAFGEQKYFQNQNQALIDKSNKFKFIQFSVTRWLSLRIDTLGNLVVFSSVLFAIIDRKNLSTGMIGLSISYALQIIDFLNWLIRQYTELETNSVAMERIREYSMFPSEAQWDLEKTRKENWPSLGNITFENYDLRYRENLPLVLKNINLKLYAGEKIGIVGRTGAGKSSLNLALFRLVEPANGTIKIDDVDISTLGLHDLRKNITILPQEPVIFCGTVRENLDPFNVHTESELYQSLETAHLKDWVSSLPEGIDYECGEGGANLSVGQKQLLCLSRALLRKSKVLILDEVTASVDVETDGLVMQTIKDYFKFSTIIIIAHRINTILDTDRIVVMDNGKIVEIDTPSNLLAMPSGIFKSLHEQSIKNDL